MLNIFIKTTPPPYDIFENANRWKRAEGTMDFGLGMYNEYPATIPEKDFYISEMSNVKLPVISEKNVYLNGAAPYKNGRDEVHKGTGPFRSYKKGENTIRVWPK